MGELNVSSKEAILLMNLGTPDEPTAPAIARYLGEFLGDRRVVDIPKLLWYPILYGIILRKRPAKLAPKYAAIWEAEGAPLKAITARQARFFRLYFKTMVIKRPFISPCVIKIHL